MYKIGGDEMMVCPYNPHHVLKKLRIQRHILKCKKNYPEINLVTCVYNYSHRLKPELLLEHYEICPFKIRLDTARYCEPCNFNFIGSVKSKPSCMPFPDLNARARILPEPDDAFSRIDHADSQYLGSSDSDSESINSQQGKDKISDHLEDADDDSEDDLEPLPLPKTVSKAFVCVQEPKKYKLPVTVTSKGFGRGKNFLNCSSPKPSRTTDHLFPDLSGVECNTVKKEKPCWFLIKNTESIGSHSSGCDDITLNSLDISSLDEDIIDESFILKDFDKYVKI